MAEKIKREYINIFNYAQNNIFLVGILGLFGFPLYYYIWQYIYPQNYENLQLRLFCSALFLPWLFYHKLPTNLAKIFPIYFFFSLFIAIPLFFTFMLFANNFSDIWLMSYLAAIYLAILLLYHWWLIIIMFSLAIAFNMIFYSFDTIAISQFNGFQSKYIPVYLFAIISSILCHKTEKRSQFKIRNMRSYSGSVAHEMRNPLNAINLIATRIRNLIITNDNNIKQNLDPKDIEEINKNLNIISGCTNKASEVIDIILSNLKEKIKQQKLEYFSISNLLLTTINQYGFKDDSQKQIIQLDIDDDFTVKVDEASFIYVIFNLLKNSLYYTNLRPNQYIKISLKKAVKNNKYHQLIIEDNGPGIPHDKIKYIFDSFYSFNKKNGAGLGLDFCKKTMINYGGDITCESQLNKFTKFILKFPKLSSEKTSTLENKHITNIIILQENKISQNSLNLKKTLEELSVSADFLIKENTLISKLKSCDNYSLILIDANINNINNIIKKVKNFNKSLPLIIFNANKLDDYKYVKIMPDEIIYQSNTQSYLIYRTIAKWHMINKIPKDFNKLQNNNSNQIKILLADDEDVNRAMLAKILSGNGFKIDEAKNGQELCDKFFTNNSYDIIISDINMPKISGYEAIKKIRNSFKDIPIIAYSGDNQKDKIHKLLKLKINDYFIKGNDINYLSNLIKFWVIYKNDNAIANYQS
jgi:two-component system, CAI-1 autoinducer sensor kinase/phosphatase CqsS|tara:strand:- start:37982 stop:40072 length:2091 start_codon:yes stop_codon:yes gene_type:complete